MNLKQLLQSISEEAKGNKKSLTRAYARVRAAAKRQLAGGTSDDKPESMEQAKKFLAQGKGPARRA